MTTNGHPVRARAARAGAAACLATVLCSCASVPTAGPIVSGGAGENRVGQQGSYVRLLPAGPQQDVQPERLIRDFLRDMGSLEDDHRAARLFMTPGRQAQWRPNGTVLVHDDIAEADIQAETAEDGESATVRMRAKKVATIDASGQYMPVDRDETIDVTFTLDKVKGQWRISDLPEELVLTRRDIERVYRPLNLYYFNRDHSTLVPDPVFIPAGTDKIPTQLVKMLANGPSDWLDPAVRTSFPADVKAAVASSGGRVTVELTSPGGGADLNDPYEMGAQLAWTLRQLAEVQEFTVRMNGVEVEIPEAQGEVHQVSDGLWNSVNPSGASDGLHAYFTREGRLWSLSAPAGKQEVGRVAGAAGTGEVQLEQHAVSLDEGKVAGISATGEDEESVVVAEVVEGSHFRTVLDGGAYTALSWDGYDELWVAEDLGGAEKKRDDPRGTRLWLVKGGDATQVDAPELTGRTVTRMRASRDGTRVAVLTEDDDGGAARLFVGRVVEEDGEVDRKSVV